MDYFHYFIGLIVACGFLLGLAIWWQVLQIKLLLKSSTTRFVNSHGKTPSVVIRARKRERCAGVHYVCLRGSIPQREALLRIIPAD
jgi:hypothetical protein